MADRPTPAARIQVYLTDRRLVAALTREARTLGVPVSQAAGRAIARGLARSPRADPDDRLLQLERALRGHMRSTQRDVQIIQELVVELARAFFLRLPDAVIDEDPVILAAVEARIDRMLDAVARTLIAGGSVRPPDEPEPGRRP